MARKQRPIPEINAGSMADIAFLLLIFFLVTTTMDTDTGIKAMLPPMPPEGFEPPPMKKKNIFEIRINSNNQMLVEGEYIEISQLKDKTVKFITNWGKDENLSENPTKAIISLKNDRGTNYDIYIQVQDQLRIAYNEVRNQIAQDRYQRSFDDLTAAQQKLIQADYPQKISEAEPEAIGGH